MAKLAPALLTESSNSGYVFQTGNFGGGTWFQDLDLKWDRQGVDDGIRVVGHCIDFFLTPVTSEATQEVTQGQIFSQSPTDATRLWWHLYGS
jgi:hypothetical protein